jgi:hypothetical protein
MRVNQPTRQNNVRHGKMSCFSEPPSSKLTGLMPTSLTGWLAWTLLYMMHVCNNTAALLTGYERLCASPPAHLLVLPPAV